MIYESVKHVNKMIKIGFIDNLKLHYFRYIIKKTSKYDMKKSIMIYLVIITILISI